jgi:hypothetical protein
MMKSPPQSLSKELPTINLILKFFLQLLLSFPQLVVFIYRESSYPPLPLPKGRGFKVPSFQGRDTGDRSGRDAGDRYDMIISIPFLNN